MTEKPRKQKRQLVIHIKTAKASCENLMIAGAVLDALTFAIKLETFAVVLLGKLVTCAGLGSIYFARVESKNPHHETIILSLPDKPKRKPKKGK